MSDWQSGGGPTYFCSHWWYRACVSGAIDTNKRSTETMRLRLAFTRFGVFIEYARCETVLFFKTPIKADLFFFLICCRVTLWKRLKTILFGYADLTPVNSSSNLQPGQPRSAERGKKKSSLSIKFLFFLSVLQCFAFNQRLQRQVFFFHFVCKHFSGSNKGATTGSTEVPHRFQWIWNVLLNRIFFWDTASSLATFY